MLKSEIAVVLALCAALASAIGAVSRQRSAHEVADEPVGHWELFRMSLRDTRWWIGGGGAVANYSLQAAALAVGSVMLVTALQVTALLFALPVNARLTHQRVTRRQWMWATVLAVALAVVVTVGDPKAGQSQGSLTTWTVVALVWGPLLVFCVLGARIWPGPRAAVLLAVVAGSSLALFAVLTKAVVAAAGHGFGALLCAPEFYVWILAALAGMVFQQSSFRAGALTASMPSVTVAKPAVASVLGIVVLGETLKANGVGMIVMASAAIVVIVAIVALARGEAHTRTFSEQNADTSPMPTPAGFSARRPWSDVNPLALQDVRRCRRLASGWSPLVLRPSGRCQRRRSSPIATSTAGLPRVHDTCRLNAGVR